jgi:hypothetical protein
VRDSDSLDFGTGTLGIHVEVRELYRTVAASLDADVRNTDGSEIPAAESPIENVAAPGGGKAVRYRTRSSGGGDRVTAELVQGPDALLQLVTVGASDSARDALDQGDCAALEAKILATLEVGLRRLPRTAETRVLWSWGRAQLVVDLPRGTLLTRSRGYCGQACAGLSFSRDVVSYDVHIVAPNGQPRAVLAISADALDARGPYPLALRAPGAPAPVALPPGHVAGSVAACPARFDAKAPFTATGADDFDLVCELSVPAPEKPLLRIFGSAADAATLAPARSIASAVRLVILP